MKLWKIQKRWWVVAALLILIAAGGTALYIRVNSVEYKVEGLMAELREDPPGFFEGWLIKLGLKSERERRETKAIVRDLFRLDPGATPRLIVSWPNIGTARRRELVVALAQNQVPAERILAVLVISLDDEDFLVRFNATQVLVRIDPVPKTFVPKLAEVLKAGKGPLTLRESAELLVKIDPGTTHVVPVLAAALKVSDPPWLTQLWAAAELGQIGPEAKAAVPALIDALKDKDDGVRTAAAWALGRIGPVAKEALPALLDAESDVYFNVSKAAGEAIRKIRESEE